MVTPVTYIIFPVSVAKTCCVAAGSEVKLFSHVRLFVTPWTVAHQAPPSMGFSRQEYWSGLPFLSRGDLPNPGIEPRSPALQADALTSEPPGAKQFRSTFKQINHLYFTSIHQELISNQFEALAI